MAAFSDAAGDAVTCPLGHLARQFTKTQPANEAAASDPMLLLDGNASQRNSTSDMGSLENMLSSLSKHPAADSKVGRAWIDRMNSSTTAFVQKDSARTVTLLSIP